MSSVKNLYSKIRTDGTTATSQIIQKISQNSQNKYVILLIIILIISGISYGYIHRFVGNEWLFSVFLILIFAFAAILRFILNIPTIYVIIFLLVSVSGLLFFVNKLAGIIMSVIVGLLLLHLLYIVVVKSVNVTESINNFFSGMSISSVTDAWNSITKITNFLCDYFVKGFLVQLVSKSMFIIFLMYLALVVYIYTKQPYQIVSDNKSIFLCIFLFIGFALLSLLVMGFEEFVPFIKSFLKYTTLIGIVLGIILAILHVYNNVPMIANTVLFAINIAILVGIFAMIVKFIGAEAPGYITGPPSWSGLLFETLIYIPCLFLNAVEFFKTELKLAQTQWTYFIILVIEIILIALLFVLPKVFDAVINHNGEIILDSVLPLNKKKTLQVTTTDSNNNQTLSLTPTLADRVKTNQPTYNYGLSAWFYIHPQPKNTNSSYTTPDGVSILDFSGAPTINYDASNNVLFMIVNGSTISKDFQPKSQIPLQRWNHLFINFNNYGTMDVFLNNNLETSVPKVFPPLITSLTVGTNKGIYGQACNVVYYQSVLGSDAISWIYNTHKYLNPPTSPNF
uniref:Uncharacterized protein n=1 Tax=viral metagenome TaxID=1070528 RepID=A0A6C0EZC1_9ZZZZ